MKSILQFLIVCIVFLLLSYFFKIGIEVFDRMLWGVILMNTFQILNKLND